MSDRSEYINNLYDLRDEMIRLVALDGKDLEKYIQSVIFAINSLEVDEAYQLEYEHIPYITLDELKEIREEIDHSGKDLMNGTSAEYAYKRGWNDALDYVLLAILDKKIHELEGNDSDNFPAVVGADCEMYIEDLNEWVRGKIVKGYRFDDGIVTIETPDGKTYWCGQARTDLYRKVEAMPKEK